MGRRLCDKIIKIVFYKTVIAVKVRTATTTLVLCRFFFLRPPPISSLSSDQVRGRIVNSSVELCRVNDLYGDSLDVNGGTHIMICLPDTTFYIIYLLYVRLIYNILLLL